MQALKSKYVPGGLHELPHSIFSSLTQLHPDALDAGLASVVERIARAADADSGTLLEIKKLGETDVLCHWSASAHDRPSFDVQTCPWVLAQVLSDATVMFARVPEDVPLDAMEDLDTLIGQGVRSLLVVPVSSAGRQLAVALVRYVSAAAWEADVTRTVRFVLEMMASTLAGFEVHEQLNRARVDLNRLNQRLDSQVRVFSEDIRTVHDFDEIVGSSAAFVTALNGVRDVANTDASVLLLGETGTGKELFARAIHDRSPRRQRPFVCVNCAALPPSLIESELFGHERGAFTGAITSRQGRFELADKGTIFLDEIGDLPLDLQPKLLRVLQEREIERVGSATRRKVDVRVVAATHQDLGRAVEEGRFRADLYYRLSVFPIALPPLRERRDDIPHLVWFLINQRQRRLHRRITNVPKHVMEALQAYHWPGNVRELENVIERAMIRSHEGTLHVDETLIATRAVPVDGATLEAVERAHIESMLQVCRGRINGPGNAAERLGLHPNTLRFRMQKLGIVRKNFVTGVKAS